MRVQTAVILKEGLKVWKTGGTAGMGKKGGGGGRGWMTPGTAAKGVHTGDWSRPAQSCEHRLCHVLLDNLVLWFDNGISQNVKTFDI